MNVNRTRQAILIFQSVVDLSDAGRIRVLDDLCGNDIELRAEVECLIACDRGDWQELDSPILDRSELCELGAMVTAETDMPEKIGSYQLIEVIGEGAMGVVYRAKQLVPEREVAVKVIRPGHVSADAMRRFANEGAALARLRHPCIGQVFESGTDSSSRPARAFLVMELIGGDPLNEIIADRQVDLTDRLKLMVRLCDAVDYAHRQGVIHRDLKPANIRVEHHGLDVQPKILDFGIARIVNVPSVSESLATMPGQLLGTLAYMSPEQLRGECGGSVDVYALGVLLFEMVTRQMPIVTAGRSLPQIIAEIEGTDPRKPSSIVPGIAKDIDAIILKALEKDIHRRYPSAAELAEDIRRFQANMPVKARTQSTMYVVSKFARRRRGTFVACCVAGTAIFVGAAMGWFGVYQANRSIDQLAEMSGYFAMDVARNLDSITGTFEVRKDMLARVQSQLDSLLTQRPDDPKLLNAYADVLQLLGNIDRDEERISDSMVRRDEAIKIRRVLCERFPEDPEFRASLSIDQVLIGDLLRKTSGLDECRIWYERALRIQEEIVGKSSERIDWLDDLGWSYERLAFIAVHTYRFDAADSLLAKRDEICRRLHSVAPDDVRTDAAFRSAAWMRGDFESRKGQLTLAYAAYQNAYRHAKSLFDRDQNNRTTAIYCASAALRMTLAPEEFSDDIPRMEYFRIAERITERFEYLEPDCEASRRLRLELEYKRFHLAMRTRDFQTCHQAIDRQLSIGRKLHQDNPTQDAATAYESALSNAIELSRAEGDLDSTKKLEDERIEFFASRGRSPNATPRDKARFACSLAQTTGPDKCRDEVRRLARSARHENQAAAPDVIASAGCALAIIGDLDEARQYYDEALSLIPKAAALHTTLKGELNQIVDEPGVDSMP